MSVTRTGTKHSRIASSSKNNKNDKNDKNDKNNSTEKW